MAKTYKEQALEIYNDYLVEAKPLIAKVNSLGNIETKNFTVKVVYKEPHTRITMLYHDWVKIIEGSLNHNDIQEKVYAYVNNDLALWQLHSDFLAHAKWVNEKYCDNELKL